MSPFLHGAIMDKEKLSINHFHKAPKTKRKFRVIIFLIFYKKKIKMFKNEKNGYLS